MQTKKTNTQKLNFLIKEWYLIPSNKKKRTISLKKLKDFGFSTRGNEIKDMGNFKIIKHKPIIGDEYYKLSVVDRKKDLKGIELNDKHPSHNRLAQNYNNKNHI